MKKIMNWMLAAILICGASVFTACTSNEDNPAPVPQPDINLAEKIVGKWMVAELDGEPCPTNLKTVVTFDSPTKAFGSLSDFYSITDKDMVLSSDWTVLVDGTEVYHEAYGEERWERVTKDYETAFLGLWEGKVTRDLGDETNDELHRWECMAAGTYAFYDKVDNKWVEAPHYLAWTTSGWKLPTTWQTTSSMVPCSAPAGRTQKTARNCVSGGKLKASRMMC